MFSNDTINHHFNLTKTGGDWSIDPRGEGKHPVGWLQQSVDSIPHSWFKDQLRSLSLIWWRSAFAYTLSSGPVLSHAGSLHTITGDWWHVRVKTAIKTATKKTISTQTLTSSSIAQSYPFVFQLTELPYSSSTCSQWHWLADKCQKY